MLLNVMQHYTKSILDSKCTNLFDSNLKHVLFTERELKINNDHVQENIVPRHRSLNNGLCALIDCFLG